ncbi:MAG: hypothetical protein KBS77_03670 [Bacteroidales bacterium]|nr:hypothetical protein [Candidatus Colicola faecequi]
MKRLLLIGSILCVTAAFADDYVDDLYYSESVAVEQEIMNATLVPHYDKSKMQEVVFIIDEPTDSISADTLNHANTVIF